MATNRHPWIFAGAIHSERGPEDAAFANLVDADGTHIASGFYSKSSQIRMRVLAFGDEELNEALLATRIRNAIARRRAIFEDGMTNCARVVHAEGDDLSSLVVDCYNDVLVVEIANRGVEQIKPLIVDVLQRELQPRAIYFKNDLPLRKTEGLATTNEWWSDSLKPVEDEQKSDHEERPDRLKPVAPLVVLESKLQFRVDPEEGQKTGFFLDQRENRRIARTLASGRRVLNLFSYTGGFGVYAAAGGAASVTNVDVSARAIEVARENHALNGLDGQFTVADAFQYVRQSRETFDLVVCDPPAFAKSRNEVDRAARGYKDVNLFAMRMLAPGGLMMTFSCSGHLPLDLFQKIIFAAALDAGRRISFVRRLTAGPDHPVSIYCPEGEYLKGFLLEVH